MVLLNLKSSYEAMYKLLFFMHPGIIIILFLIPTCLLFTHELCAICTQKNGCTLICLNRPILPYVTCVSYVGPTNLD